MLLALVLPFVLPSQSGGVNLSYKAGVFSIAAPSGTSKVVINQPEQPAPKTWEINEFGTRVTWNEKGLTVSKGAYKRTTQFRDIPTSPRLFSREQIRTMLEGIEAGDRAAEASALAGHELLGENLYLLVRWNDKANKPLFEAIIQVDLTPEKPWFKVLYRSPGVSQASGPVSDELFLANNRLCAVATVANKWGLSTWDLKGEFVRYFQFGTGLFRWSIPGAAPRELLFVERTEYNSWLAGRVNLATFERTELGESKEKASFVSTDPVTIRFDSVERSRIRYADSGLEQEFLAWTAARQTPQGLLMWHPARSPRQAVLFRTGTFQPLAKWGYAADE